MTEPHSQPRDFVIREAEDCAKREPELFCSGCWRHLCDVEHGGTLTVLAGAAATHACFRWWVYIEREDGPDLAVGPYQTEAAAKQAGEHSALIDDLLSPAGGGGTDCYWSEDQPTAEHERVFIDPDDPHHTGACQWSPIPLS